MGLMASLNSVEAAQSLVMAKAIGIALGDTRALAEAVYYMTGNARLAQRTEIQAQRRGNGKHG